MTDWHNKDTQSVQQELGVSAALGLDDTEAASRFAQTGPNELIDHGMKSPWRILWEQFTATMVLILLAAALVSGLLGKVNETISILAIVVLFSLLGFTQEYRAEKAMAALKKMSSPVVRARRAGQLKELPARALVSGDIILLEAGNVIPADARMVESYSLRAQESVLTGESEPVDKHTDAIAGADLPLGDRRNMVYMGTIVTYGRGTAVVVATGMQAELGNIATALQAVKHEQTPLQKRLDQLGKWLALAGVITAALVMALGLLRGEDFREMFLAGVSVAVAVVPEGLPAVVTFTLALGARRMLKRNALIRKLPAVETLGAVTVICTDKTGTLTENRMTVVALDVAGHSATLGDDIEGAPGDATRSLRLLLTGAALCNDATISPAPVDGGTSTVGDPTEAALLVAAMRMGLQKAALERDMPRVAELAFDSERKCMTTVHRMGEIAHDTSLPPSPYIAFTKGSVDGILTISDHVMLDDGPVAINDDFRTRIERANAGLAARGMRVLGVGFKPVKAPLADANAERALIFIGLIAMIDPPRAEVTVAVQTCKTAGIRAIMITGDHPLTARAIAEQLGISANGKVVTGQQLTAMSDAELTTALADTSVFARVSPAHKLRIVEALQAQGEVVAMTGDGVNDAPALKRADIGVAMGITGTDVSKEASDTVLLDDNFATIVSAVAEGRTIYDNVKRFVKFSIAGNIGKIAVMLIAPLLALQLPLLPLQLLWLNLLTDGLLGLGLGVEPADRNIMRRAPRSKRESIFAGGMTVHIAWMGALITVLAGGVGLVYWSAGLATWQTMIFSTLAFCQVAQALAVRSQRDSLFTLGLFSNKLLFGLVVGVVLLQLMVLYVPFMDAFLNVESLTLVDLAISLGLGSCVLIVSEVEKAFIRRRVM